MEQLCFRYDYSGNAATAAIVRESSSSIVCRGSVPTGGLPVSTRNLQRKGSSVADDLATVAGWEEFGGSGAGAGAGSGRGLAGTLPAGGGRKDLRSHRWLLPSTAEIAETDSQPSERPNRGTTARGDAGRLARPAASAFS